MGLWRNSKIKLLLLEINIANKFVNQKVGMLESILGAKILSGEIGRVK
jgi:hypothetical protein